MFNPAGSFKIRSFAKINLALSVLGKRADGYHEIQTVFQTVDLCDELEFKPSARIEVQCDGLPDIRQEDNLVWKAADRLAAACGTGLGASIVLKKRIPSGAGLGGGSGNAAATLLGLRRFWNLQMADSELCPIAEKLGSDVPFFLEGGTALGTGRGEQIHSIPEIPARHLVILFPGVQVPTAEAYRSLNLGLTSAREDHRIQRFVSQVEARTGCLTGIFNDFEASILAAYPPIREAKAFLEQRGATAALLSGSGSSVFGFFSDEESAFAASRDVSRLAWRVFPAKTLSRAEYFHKMFG
jgi:4-diphosphocytidyl-2-C-methyl-D-erythritol kinase